MDRRDAILGGLDLHGLKGLEIGPLSKPLVTKDQGLVLYVDHADTASLRAKYGENSYYDLADFVDVDVVWNGGQLKECLPPGFAADYIVASHVIEHVPDLIRWLDQLWGVLSQRGEVRLAIPDKRFIFDRFRRTTRVSDVLGAWVRKDLVPDPQAIIDYQASVVHADVEAIWQGRAPLAHRILAGQYKRGLDVARAAAAEGRYEDAHCWVFTPLSFAELMAELARIGVLHFRCSRFIDTPDLGMEFYVGLQPCDQADAAAASWDGVLPGIHRDPSLELSAGDLLEPQRSVQRAYAGLVGQVNAWARECEPDQRTAALPYAAQRDASVTAELLTSTLWRYSQLGSSIGPSAIQFLPGGTVGAYQHELEAGWRVQDGTLSLLHADGRESIRFEQVLQGDRGLVLRGRHLLVPGPRLVMVLEQWQQANPHRRG